MMCSVQLLIKYRVNIHRIISRFGRPLWESMKTLLPVAEMKVEWQLVQGAYPNHFLVDVVKGHKGLHSVPESLVAQDTESLVVLAAKQTKKGDRM